MKRLLILAASLTIASCLYAGDALLNRPDLYGTPATQWNYVTFNSTAVIKTSPGILHCITVTSAPASIWSVRDSSDTDTVPVVISTFNVNAQLGNYCYDAISTEGLAIMLPASGLCSMTASYR